MVFKQNPDKKKGKKDDKEDKVEEKKAKPTLLISMATATKKKQ